MTSPENDAPETIDLQPDRDRFMSEIIDGLREDPKLLPCKYLYDQRGSELFDRICEVEAYYPTRTEMSIFRANIDAIVERCGRRCALIEYGSGSGMKTRFLLEHLDDPAALVPIEISREHLDASVRELAEVFPNLRVIPICGDYTQKIEIPPIDDPQPERRVVFFPGSTIGNFHRDEAQQFLARAARVAGSGGGLLIGVDLKKDPAVLERAYDDPDGVTREFNLNILRHINRELGANFDLDAFEHRAVYNEDEGRVEMRLVSERDQTVRLNGDAIAFETDEYIRTECSYKYTIDEFHALARDAGWTPGATWTDPQKLFSVHFMTA
ncbi:MAG: L-histidine N(alpha)-methyltransferase [Phycisphaerales bacterium]